MTCSACGEATSNTYGLCDACCLERTRADRLAQGLPEMATDDPAVAAWLAHLLLERNRFASKAAS